jgi:hypothetical protein
LYRYEQLFRQRYLHVELVQKVKQVGSLNELLDERICTVVVVDSQELDYIRMLGIEVSDTHA